MQQPQPCAPKDLQSAVLRSTFQASLSCVELVRLSVYTWLALVHSDSVNHVIWAMNTATGSIVLYAGVYRVNGYSTGPSNVSKFGFPFGLTLDPAGNLYVVDFRNHVLQVVYAGGATVGTVTGNRSVNLGIGNATGASGTAAMLNWATVG